MLCDGIDFQLKNMGKKRKRSEKAEAVAVPKKDDAAPERPVRTLLGWKDKNETEVKDNEDSHSPVFRNKEKVLVTCSRRIIYRYKPQTLIYFVLVTLFVVYVYACFKDNDDASFEYGFVYVAYIKRLYGS